jgi:MraZ protein
MLLGEYEHTIDDKNRLTLPAKFRQAFDEGLVLTRGIERCLSAYPRSNWTETGRVAAARSSTRSARKAA